MVERGDSRKTFSSPFVNESCDAKQQVKGRGVSSAGAGQACSTHLVPPPSSRPASQQPGDASHHPLFAPQRSLTPPEPTDNCLWGKRGNNL